MSSRRAALVSCTAIAVSLVACGEAAGPRHAADVTSGDVEPDTSDDGRVDVDAGPEVGDGAADIDEGDMAAEVEDVGGDASDTAGHLGDATSDVPSEPASTGFQASGLLVRIIAPGSHGTGAATAPSARVSGILFGNAETMIWQAGATSGAIVPATFWQSGAIELVPGDNRITVTAVGGGQSISDTIVITYNPSFAFDDGLTATPDILWAGTSTETVFTIPDALARNVDATSVKLLRVDAEGGLVAEQGPMRDDGEISSSGDEIERDGIYTYTFALACTQPGPMYFRASVEVATTPTYIAVSPVMRVECLARVTIDACEAHKALLASAASALSGGADLAGVITQIEADASVASAGPAEDGGRAAWVEFDDGVLGAVLDPVAGERGGGTSPLTIGSAVIDHALVGANALAVGSNSALVYSPFATELGASDEGAAIASELDASECPHVVVEGRAALTDTLASLARLRGLSADGYVAIATHGAALFGGASAADRAARFGWRHAGPQEVLWSGSSVECDGLLQAERACVVTHVLPDGGCPTGTRCVVTRGVVSDQGAIGEGTCLDETQADLRLGRAIMTNAGYAVTPSFFGAWRGTGLPKSLVYLGACDSLWNGSLASELFAAGASVVAGFSGAVTSAFAYDQGVALFAGIGQSGALGQRFVPAVNPVHAETHWRLFGSTNLSLDASDLINASFEAGSTAGWERSGDGRVVGEFGASPTVDGKFMAVVSSGLGYSIQTGRLEQTFCISEDKTEAELYWRFYSEEFREWCGDPAFQDQFSAVLVDEAGEELPLVHVAIDDLCQYGDGVCAACDAPKACDGACAAQEGCYLTADQTACTGTFNCQCGRDYSGLTESEIEFDQGGAYETQWQHAVVDVSSLAGRGPVILRLEVRDSGDSQFDTAVLIDDIEFH